MADIIKQEPGSIGAGSRKRFLRRYKDQVREQIQENFDKTDIKGISKKRKVKISSKTLDEPSYQYDVNTGKKEYVGNSNDAFRKGDKSGKSKSRSEKAQQGAGHGEDETHDFMFELTKEELIDILFENMDLPDYIKEGIKTDSTSRLVRRGHTVDGIPVNINPVKTIMAAMARKIAYKGALNAQIEQAETEEEKEKLRNKRIPYLEDTDLRYKRYDIVKEPVRHATMILLMDISGSMTRKDRDMAKRFFLLLYLFLEQAYSSVDLRFVTYTEYAQEVDEQEFFYGCRSGGTSVLSAAKVVAEIISSIDISKDNIYLAHVSDGDIDKAELEPASEVFIRSVLPYIQYVAYVELRDKEYIQGMLEAFSFYSSVSAMYLILKEHFNHIGVTWAADHEHIFPALQELFRREK